jgi:predicted alpha/beta hydrolase
MQAIRHVLKCDGVRAAVKLWNAAGTNRARISRITAAGSQRYYIWGPASPLAHRIWLGTQAEAPAASCAAAAKVNRGAGAIRRTSPNRAAMLTIHHVLKCDGVRVAVKLWNAAGTNRARISRISAAANSRRYIW